MGFISRIEDRHAEITAQIASLVAERDELDAALRVFARLGAEQESTAARTDVPHEAGDGLGESLNEGAHPVRDTEAGNQAPPVDTNSAATLAADTGEHPAPTAEVAPPAASAAHSPEGQRSSENTSCPQREGQSSKEPPEQQRDTLGVTTGRDRDAGGSPATSPGMGKPGEGEQSSSPAPSLAARLRALNAEHPEFTVEQAAQVLGLTRTKCKSNSDANKIKWAKAPKAGAPTEPGLNERIRDTHFAHRDWTDMQIAEHHGCGAAYVRTTAKRMGFTLSSRRATGKPFQPGSEPHAPSRAQEPERQPGPARAPIATQPPGSAIITTPIRRATGRLFWLRNDAGEYLDRYCNSMTSDRRAAWTGTESQLLACRIKFAIARDLVERPVEKEQARAVA